MINGVIEGFYGKPWPHTDRLTYPQFLQNIGCNTYVYAPKADEYLRKQWQLPWPQSELKQLKALAQVCEESSIQLGMGLSPLGLMSCFDARAKLQLNAKLNSMKTLGVSLLCVLFDDIPGDSEQLAAQQLAVCDFVERQWQGDLIMCPTYYSSDPALPQHFGAMPNNYWSSLAQGLSSRWQIFWTGEQVVSLSYDANELAKVATTINRKPIIWDNYPVNDGRLMWPYLNFSALDRSMLSGAASGVLHNPMNQPQCSKLTLARMKGFESQLPQLLDAPEALIKAVLHDSYHFQHTGLEQFSKEDSQGYQERYTHYDHPIAYEILAWLNGDYAFDPECLT